MIKFAIRRNLIYPLQFLLWNIVRDVETSLISYFFGLSNLLIYTPLMFLGEFLAGFIFYIYQIQFIPKETIIEQTSNLNIKYIHTESNIKKELDKELVFLLFIPAFYDFIQFSFSLQISKFKNISSSLKQRLRGTFTINYTLIYFYVLRIPIFRHQKFSLIVLSICVIIVLVTEFIFQDINIFLTYGLFILAIVYITITLIFSTFMEIIEKYLFECCRLNPFFVLMFEGIFGFISTFIFCMFHNPFHEIIKFKNNSSISEYVILIFTFILYMILSGGNNLFRVITTKKFNPMTSSLVYYILNPFFMIYYYISGSDFISNGKINFTYFIINFIVSLILSFINCVYNEFIVLFFCGLEADTHQQITQRSKNENELIIMNTLDEQESESTGS